MPLQVSITTGTLCPSTDRFVDQICRADRDRPAHAGEQMPSVRALAEQLVINPNTVARTYAELIREGVLEAQQGKGVFVARRRAVYTQPNECGGFEPRSERLRQRGDLSRIFLPTSSAKCSGASSGHFRMSQSRKRRYVPAMSDFAIQTHHLTRYFGGKRVVHDLNLAVPRGSIFGFLGRNGSGKTTTLRMILGLLAPSWGNSTILDHDSQNLPPEVRADWISGRGSSGAWLDAGERCACVSEQVLSQVESPVVPRGAGVFSRGSQDARRDIFARRARRIVPGDGAAPEPDLLILDDPAIPQLARSGHELRWPRGRKATFSRNCSSIALSR